MEFFHVTHSVAFTVPFPDGNVVTITLQAPQQDPDVNSIYFSTGACIQTLKAQIANKNIAVPDGFAIRVLSAADKQRIMSMPAFPRSLTNMDGTLEESNFEYIDPCNPKLMPCTEFQPLHDRLQDMADGSRTLRVFAINGFGTGMGDSIIGLRAMNIFIAQAKKYFRDVDMVLGHTAVVGSKNHKTLYGRDPAIASIKYIPLPLAELLTHDAVIDLSAMIIRSNFVNQSIMDFYLENMSIAPNSIARSDKAVFLRRNPRWQREMAGIMSAIKLHARTRLILLHTSASASIRSMPRNIIKYMIKRILDDHADHVVVTWDDITDIADDVNRYLGQRRHRHVNLAHRNAGIEAFIECIANMHAVVTVDTSSYHIAAAFNIPAVVLFTTIDSKLRIQDYDFCTGLSMVRGVNHLNNVHISFEAQHLQYMAEAWKNINYQDVLRSLRQVTNKKLQQQVITSTCPCCGLEQPRVVHDYVHGHVWVACTACGTTFSADATRQATGIELHDAAMYASQASAVQALLSRPGHAALLDAFYTHKGARCLDIDAGSGVVMQAATQLGLDAWSLAVHGQAPQQLTTCDLEHMSWPADFHVITACHVLQNQANPQAVMLALAKKLATRGMLILVDLAAENSYQHVGMINSRSWPATIQAQYVYARQCMTLASHAALAATAGLAVVYSRQQGNVASHLDYMAGDMPNLDMDTGAGNKLSLPTAQLQTFFADRLQQATACVDNWGDYIVTVMIKP